MKSKWNVGYCKEVIQLSNKNDAHISCIKQEKFMTYQFVNWVIYTLIYNRQGNCKLKLKLQFIFHGQEMNDHCFAVWEFKDSTLFLRNTINFH